MELIDKIQTISCWRRGDQRASHKPLMLLYALSQYKQGHERLFQFESEVDSQVKELLVQYGPSRKAYHPEYPFWRLANEQDPFWELKNGEECIPRKSNTDPKKSELIKYNVMAGFDANSYQNLISNPELIDKIASKTISLIRYRRSCLFVLVSQLIRQLSKEIPISVRMFCALTIIDVQCVDST